MQKCAAAILLAVLPSATLAQRADNDFYAKAGGFFSTVDSTLRIDSNSGRLGTEIDFEGDLGLTTKKAMPFALAGWRFSDRWRAEIEYFRLARDRTHVIDRTLTIGDTVFPVNGSVSAGLSTDVYRAAIGYSFAHGDKFEIGANAGLHLSKFEVFVEGQGNAGTLTGVLRRESRDQLVPLPTLGFYGTYNLDDTFALISRMNYFQLKISDYKGQLIDGSIGITAQLTKNFGVGADFRYVDYRLRATGDNFTGRINYRFYGPFLYAAVGF